MSRVLVLSGAHCPPRCTLHCPPHALARTSHNSRPTRRPACPPFPTASRGTDSIFQGGLNLPALICVWTELVLIDRRSDFQTVPIRRAYCIRPPRVGFRLGGSSMLEPRNDLIEGIPEHLRLEGHHAWGIISRPLFLEASGGGRAGGARERAGGRAASWRSGGGRAGVRASGFVRALRPAAKTGPPLLMQKCIRRV